MYNTMAFYNKTEAKDDRDIIDRLLMLAVPSKNVMIIGPDRQRSRGGIASVIDTLMHDKKLAEDVHFIAWPSYIDGPLIRRAVYSLTRELIFRFRRHRSDIYHVHMAYGTSFWRKRRYVRCLRTQASRVVLHIHGSRFSEFWERLTPRQQRKVRTLFDKVGKIIVLSSSWRDFFLEHDLCDPERLAVLPNAVPLPKRAVTDYANHNVLFMGRLEPRKAPDVLIKAALRVVSAEPEARFTFAGDGDPYPYQKLASDLGIADACRFVEWVTGDEKEKLYLSHGIFCLPSQAEGLPVSILEAMSYGLATIATPVGGIPDVIRPGQTGLLVSVGDAPTLATCIIRLMRDVPLKQKIGERARMYIKNFCSPNDYADKLLQIYEEVSG